jgi:hypothetical protein
VSNSFYLALTPISGKNHTVKDNKIEEQATTTPISLELSYNSPIPYNGSRRR